MCHESYLQHVDSLDYIVDISPKLAALFTGLDMIVYHILLQ